MARINVEDAIYRDRRFFNLAAKVGGPEAALGAIVFAWDLAQKFWKTSQKLIPPHEWKRLGFADDILECGLAELRDGLVYVCGSEEQFRWLDQKVTAGRNGGLAKASAAKRTLAPAKRSLPSSSPSSSSSASSSKTNTYAQQVERVYQGFYPRKIGKTKGVGKLAREIKTPEDMALLECAIKNYATASSGKAMEYIKHFSTFASEWRDWTDSSIVRMEGLTAEDLRKKRARELDEEIALETEEQLRRDGEELLRGA